MNYRSATFRDGTKFFTRWAAFEDVVAQVRRDQNFGLMPRCDTPENLALEAGAMELLEANVKGYA